MTAYLKVISKVILELRHISVELDTNTSEERKAELIKLSRSLTDATHNIPSLLQNWHEVNEIHLRYSLHLCDISWIKSSDYTPMIDFFNSEFKLACEQEGLDISLPLLSDIHLY
jgi:hypothetical protein